MAEKTKTTFAQGQLRAIVERIERLEEEKKTIAGDVKEVYAEAKGNGFDVPTIKKIVRIRKLDHAERQEQDALLDLYMSALGMLPADELSRVHAHEDRTEHTTAPGEPASAGAAVDATPSPRSLSQEAA